MGVRLLYQVLSGDIVKNAQDFRAQMARAATGAMRDAGDHAKLKGRAAMAAAGFSARFQNALRSNVYPKGKDSLSPAAFVFHKIRYAGIFEEGGSIPGSPFLWLPLPNVPLGAGGRRITVQQYIERIGPLKSINIPGKPPMLAGQGSTASITRATAKAVRARKKAVASGAILGAWVPLFVGVASVDEPKKFDIAAAAREAAAKLGEFYVKHFEE